MEDVPHPVLRAALEGNLRLIKEMAPVAGKGNVWNRALVLAAIEGHLDVCRYLVEDIRVDVNWLSDKGKHETVELLLSRGVDVDLFDSLRGTPLHIAANKGEAGTMKILLEHHADPNKIFNLHSNPLGMAIQKESLECVRLLIKAGADPNFIDYNGFTYTMVAANNGLPDIMKCLLDAGANPNTPDSDCNSIAALHGRRDIVEMFFPLTFPISTLPDWSIDGIIAHVKYYGLNPRDTHPLELEEKIAKLKLEATEAFKEKEYLKAAELYNCAMQLEDRVKDYAVLLANRSFCFLRMGRGQDAVSDATKCIECRPCWAKGYYRQGAAYMLLKDYGKACKAFDDGLKLDHTNVDIMNALREAQEALKNADCAGK